MKGLFSLIIALAILHPARAGDSLRIGSMSIEWMDGFTLTSDQPPQRLVGPDGEVVLITSMGIGGSGDVQKLTKQYLEFGASQLLKLAEAKGKTVGELVTESIPGEITLFMTTTRVKTKKGWFYLQFFAVSKNGRAALFTVEGKGDPATQMKRFRPAFDTLKWISE